MFRKIAALATVAAVLSLSSLSPARADDPVSDPYDPPDVTVPVLGSLDVDVLLFLAKLPGMAPWVTLP